MSSLLVLFLFYFRAVNPRDISCVCIPQSSIYFTVVPLSPFCVLSSLCAAFAVLAFVFLPGLYSEAYRTAFLAVRVLCGCLLFVSSVFTFVCVFIPCLFILFYVSSVSLPGDDVVCWLISCPFPYVCFPSFFFSEHVPGLIWFGSVYLATTAGFIADHLM